MNNTDRPKHCCVVIFCILCFACLSVNGALIQGRYDEEFPSTQVSSTLNNVVAGSLIVIWIRPSNGGTATIVHTGSGRTFRLDARGPIITEFSAEVHSLTNAAGGTMTFTATVTGGSDQQRMSTAEFPGTYGIVHKTNSSNGSGSALSAGNVVTTIDGCLIFCAGFSDSDEFHTNPTPGSGYTTINLDGLGFDDDKSHGEWRVATTAGTFAGNMTDDQTPDWQCIVVAYAPFSGGGGSPAIAYRNKGKSVAKGFGPVF